MHRATQLVLVLSLGTLAAVLVTQDGSSPANPRHRRWIIDHESRGILQGRVRVDDGIPASHVRVGLWFDGTDGARRYTGALDEDGSFLFDPVPTGVGRITLWVEDESDPLLEVLNVNVGEGRIDPRLYKLDLTERLSRFELEILDPFGSPVSRALVAWRPFDGGDYELSVEARNGRATLVSSHQVVDLLVQAPGLRTEEVAGVDVDTRVDLREGIVVALEVPPAARDREERVGLEVQLEREDSDPRFGRSTCRAAEYLVKTRVVPVIDGTAHFALPAPGTWRVAWRAVFEDDRWVSLGTDSSAPRIAVVASYREQRFQPAFPLSELRAIRAR